MQLWKRKRKSPPPEGVMVCTAGRSPAQQEILAGLYAYELFEKVRRTVPLVDAAISKMIRLIGSFQVECGDASMQKQLDAFLRDVPVGLTGTSVYSFIDSYLDSLLIYGNAVGEIVLDREGQYIAGLWNGRAREIAVRAGERILGAGIWETEYHCFAGCGTDCLRQQCGGCRKSGIKLSARGRV